MIKKDWEINKLGDVCEIARGGSPRPIKDYITTDEDGINWIKIGDTDPSGKYIYTTSEKIKPDGLKKSRYVEAGDFLLSNSMSFGRPYVLQTNGCIHDGWLVLKNYQKSLYLDFFYYLLLSPNVQKQFEIEAKGSTVRNLNTEVVSNINVSYPPLEEQKRIVKILDEKFAQLETIKANAQTNLQNAKDLFQSQLTKAFSNTTWEKKTIGEVCAKRETIKWKNENAGNEYQYIDLSAVDRESKNISDTQIITKESAPSRAQQIVKTGDVLFGTTRPTLKRFCLLSDDYDGQICSTGFCVIRPNQNLVSPDWMFYQFYNEEFYKYIEPLQKGANYPAVTDKDIMNFIISIPSIAEQKRIVKELDTLSEKVRQLQEIYTKQIANCAELKQSLLQKAFEGEL